MTTRARRSSSAKGLFGEIERLERMIQADADAELESEANSTAKEDMKVVQEGPGEPVKDQGDQNAKAENNWPTGVPQDMTASQRERLARRLVRLAKAILDDE